MQTITPCNHLAIIMDGNGRWATKRGLSRYHGHQEGAKTAINTVRNCAKLGIKEVSLYCLSTENMRRPQEEVSFLIALLADTLVDNIEVFQKDNVAVKVLGDLQPLGEAFNKKVIRVTTETENNEALLLRVLCNYSGIWHIQHAFERALMQQNQPNKKGIDTILEEDIPNSPDLLIRTSGEKRLSNFMLYHLAYSELAFEEAYWPDFNEQHLLKHLNDFAKRSRRFGQIEQDASVS